MENEPESPSNSAKPAEDDEEEGGPIKTFLEHLEDLRWVLIRVVAALGVAFVGCFAGAPAISDFLQWPMHEADSSLRLQGLGPMTAYIVSMKIAFYGGLTLSLPVILYFVGEYIMPALKKTEKVFFLRAFIVGGGLFMGGVICCYFFILPITIKATVQFNQWLKLTTDFWRAEEYFQFVIMFMVGMGLSFELPILLLGLVKMGLINYKTLAKGRMYVIFALFVLVSFITPDFVSTFFIMGPLLILMEICIWIAWWWHKQDVKAGRA